MCLSKVELQRPGETGFVLLASLWVMVMLGVVLATMSYQVRVEATLERRFIDRSKLRLAARGAIHLAMARMQTHTESWHSRSDEWWATESHWRNIEIGDVFIDVVPILPASQKDTPQDPQYGPVDTESRININSASVDQLAALPGVSESAAGNLINIREQIRIDFGAATGQTSVRSVATENDDSRQPQLINGPITSIESVLERAGIDWQTQQNDAESLALPELLTTISSGNINVNTASLEVLAAVGLSRDSITTLVSHRRSQPIESPEELSDLVGQIDNEEGRSLFEILDTRSATFHITAVARLAQRDAEFRVEAVVFNDGERLRVVNWIERDDRG